MSEITLFTIASGNALRLNSGPSDLEKPLQTLIERNLDVLLGVRFLATEYPTGKTHGGRIDTLGLDEDSSPVILEYKRSIGENVINQGLYYLNWLMDHRAEFTLLVDEKLGKDVADSIDWSAPRLICVAGDFTKFDTHAVQEIGRNIDLVRYRRFGSELLLLEQVYGSSAGTGGQQLAKGSSSAYGIKSVSESLSGGPEAIRDLFDSLDSFLRSLGDDVQRKDLKLYIAFKRLRNFATVQVYRERLQVHAHIDPDTLDLVEGFTRDVRQVGHWGTGDLEISLRNPADLERAKPLLRQAYEGV